MICRKRGERARGESKNAARFWGRTERYCPFLLSKAQPRNRDDTPTFAFSL